MRWHRNVHLNQASKQIIPWTGKKARGEGKGVLLSEEASWRLILEDPSGSRLKTPMRIIHILLGWLSQSSLTLSICIIRFLVD